MGNVALAAVLVAMGTLGQSLTEEQIERQDKVFQQWWGTDFQWKFEELPLKGSVAPHRLPYSGYIYPDTAGGTVVALQKYDQAFHRGRYPASSYERWDTSAFQESVAVRGSSSYGLFGRRLGGGVTYVRRTPHWHGHCNGWSSATIRHAEPRHNVVRNGVTFTPSDIKGLLAELYIYNHMDVIAGDGEWLNAALFHTIVTNWLGRGKHAVAMEADPGREKWNYPIYAYAASQGPIRNNQVEVKMNLGYAKDSQGEQDVSPKNYAQKYFHYYLELNDEGEIVGGGFYRDSSRIDMIWLPLQPKAPGKPGNERGNPHIKVEEILAIWRDSVPEEVRKKWLVIDPVNEDRVLEIDEELAYLTPLQLFPVEAQAPAPPADSVAAAEVAEVEENTTETPPIGEEAALDTNSLEGERDLGATPTSEDATEAQATETSETDAAPATILGGE